MFRFVSCVCPSKDDDVITSPYNTTLALNKLINHAHCVLPVSNDALVGICNKISESEAGREAQASLTALPADERPRPPRPSAPASASAYIYIYIYICIYIYIEREREIGR